jgi:hypothetical protein
MTKKKRQDRTAAMLLEQAKAIAGSERSTMEMRTQAVQLAYEIGVNDGRLAGAVSALDHIKGAVAL